MVLFLDVILNEESLHLLILCVVTLSQVFVNVVLLLIVVFKAVIVSVVSINSHAIHQEARRFELLINLGFVQVVAFNKGANVIVENIQNMHFVRSAIQNVEGLRKRVHLV